MIFSEEWGFELSREKKVKTGNARGFRVRMSVYINKKLHPLPYTQQRPGAIPKNTLLSGKVQNNEKDSVKERNRTYAKNVLLETLTKESLRYTSLREILNVQIFLS